MLTIVGNKGQICAERAGLLGRGRIGGSGCADFRRRLVSSFARLEHIETALLAKAEEFLQDARHLTRVGVDHLEDADVLASARRAIKVVDHLLNQLHRLARRAHDDGVGANVRRQRDRLARRGGNLHLRALTWLSVDLAKVLEDRCLLAGSTRERTSRQNRLDEPHGFLHIRALESDVLDFDDRLRLRAVELRNKAANGGDVSLGTAGHDGIQAHIRLDLHDLRATAAILLRHIHLVEHARHVRRRRLRKHDDLKRLVGKLILGGLREQINKTAHDLEVLLTRCDDERVRRDIRHNRHRIGRRLRGSERSRSFAHELLNTRRDGFGASGCQREHMHADRGVRRDFIELGHDLPHQRAVLRTTSNEQTRSARISNHQRLHPLRHFGRELGVTPVEDLRNRADKAIHVRLLHRHHFDRRLVEKALGIKVDQKRLDHIKRIGARSNQQLVGPFVGGDDHALEVSGLRLSLLQAVDARVHHLLQDGGKARRARVFQIHQADLAILRRNLAVEVLQDLLDNGERTRAGRNHQRIQAIVGNHSHAILGTNRLGCDLLVEELHQHWPDARRARVLQRIHAHDRSRRGRLGIELLNELLHDFKILRAAHKNKRVGWEIGTNDQLTEGDECIALDRRGRLITARRARHADTTNLLLQRPAFRQFCRAFNKHRAQRLREIARVGVLKLDDARLDPSDAHSRIKPFAQHLDECDCFLFARNDHGVGAIVDGNGDILRERFTSCAGGLRLHLRSREPANRFSLREEFAHDARKLLRLDVLQRIDAHNGRVGHGQTIEQQRRFLERTHIVRRRCKDDRIALHIDEDLHWLLQVERDRAARAFGCDAKSTHLLLQRARQFALLCARGSASCRARS